MKSRTVRDHHAALVKSVRNSFCATGVGGGVDPTCSPTIKKTLYRASDDDTIVGSGSFSTKKEHATQYLNNPGFGGKNLYRAKIEVHDHQLLDLYEDDSHVEAFKRLGIPQAGAIGVDELIPRIADRSDVFRRHGIEWVRVKESHPYESDTWVFVGSNDPDMVMLKRPTTNTPFKIQSDLVVNPFVSQAQRAACYARKDPNWDCAEWQKKTGRRKLLKRKRKIRPTTNAARRTSIDPTRTDPTKTGVLRRTFATLLARQFARLKGKVILYFLQDDGLPKLTANSFCATGKGGGIDPSCSPHGERLSAPETIREAQNRFRQVADSVFAGLDRSRDENDAVTVVLPGDRVIHTSVKDQEKRFYVQIDFGIVGKSNTHTGEKLDAHSLSLLRTVKKVASEFHAVGLAIGVVPSDDKRLEVYDRALTRLGLRKVHDSDGRQVWNVVTNAFSEFQSDPENVKQFEDWLRTVLQSYLLSHTEEELWRAYVEEGFRKGAGRAFDDVAVQRRADLFGGAERQSFYDGSREQFLRDSFAYPVSVDKVKLLAGRSFTDLKNVTTDMSTRMTRSLMDGLVQGKSPREVARDLAKAVNVGRDRALTVARTEIIRAHAEGQLTAMEKMGVEEVGAAIEWSTSGLGTTRKGYPSPCGLCAPLKGIVLKVNEARGLIPRHPNCMCSWVPANVGEDVSGQKRSASAISAALAKSRAAVSLKRVAGKRKSVKRGNGRGVKTTSWGSGVKIDPKRPESILNVEVV